MSTDNEPLAPLVWSSPSFAAVDCTSNYYLKNTSEASAYHSLNSTSIHPNVLAVDDDDDDDDELP